MATRPRRYGIHKIFGPTIQGEGGMTGAVSHFVRFSGCNMWDGRPETKADSQCPFCDTDFFSHTMMTAEQIAQGLTALPAAPWVTLSGGEPMLQIDEELVDTLQESGFKIAVETNGTIGMPRQMTVDYLTVSPKVSWDNLCIRKADCLKLLWPHPNWEINPTNYEDFQADSFYLQPIEDEDPIKNRVNIETAVKALYMLGDPWRLGLQIHKILDVE